MLYSHQGSSASRMTAAQVIDVIARLLGCAGRADAVSATRPDTWIRLPR